MRTGHEWVVLYKKKIQAMIANLCLSNKTVTYSRVFVFNGHSAITPLASVGGHQ